jgi:hypothetical protein
MDVAHDGIRREIETIIAISADFEVVKWEIS